MNLLFAVIRDKSQWSVSRNSRRRLNGSFFDSNFQHDKTVRRINHCTRLNRPDAVTS